MKGFIQVWRYTLLYYIGQCLAFKPWESEAIEGNQKRKKSSESHARHASED